MCLKCKQPHGWPGVLLSTALEGDLFQRECDPRFGQMRNHLQFCVPSIPWIFFRGNLETSPSRINSSCLPKAKKHRHVATQNPKPLGLGKLGHKLRLSLLFPFNLKGLALLLASLASLQGHFVGVNPVSGRVRGKPKVKPCPHFLNHPQRGYPQKPGPVHDSWEKNRALLGFRRGAPRTSCPLELEENNTCHPNIFQTPAKTKQKTPPNKPSPPISTSPNPGQKPRPHVPCAKAKPERPQAQSRTPRAGRTKCESPPPGGTCNSPAAPPRCSDSEVDKNVPPKKVST